MGCDVIAALSWPQWAPAVLGHNSNSNRDGSSGGLRQDKQLFNLLHPQGMTAKSPRAPEWVLNVHVKNEQSLRAHPTTGI